MVLYRSQCLISTGIHFPTAENKVSSADNFFGIVGGGVQLGPFGTAATNRPIVTSPGDYDREIDGTVIGRGKRSTRTKPWARTRVAAVGSQRLTA
jgi:hypothetical protein